MILRILDRLEETLISVLMAAAVVLIFVAVLHRYSLGVASDLVGYGRSHDLPWLANAAREVFRSINSLKLTWAQETCIYLFIWMAKFGAAYGVRQGIHVGVDILVERLHGAARRRLTLLAMSGGILFTAVVLVISAEFVWNVRLGGQLSPDLEMPMWLIYLAVPLGSALMCFRFIQAFWRYFTTGYIAHHDHSTVDGLDDEAKDLAEGGHA
ncbi:TRAP transporter small permease [Pararhodospirillum photometricum]|nr:TRAP transporter small permease [Pararhodospirillum photometricum]